MAAVLNFLGAFASFEVAATIAKGIVNPEAVTPEVILAGLVGAITWNLITWYFGLPSSSSHALIGGVMGSAVAADGLGRRQLGRSGGQGPRSRRSSRRCSAIAGRASL